MVVLVLQVYAAASLRAGAATSAAAAGAASLKGQDVSRHNTTCQKVLLNECQHPCHEANLELMALLRHVYLHLQGTCWDCGPT